MASDRSQEWSDLGYWVGRRNADDWPRRLRPRGRDRRPRRALAALVPSRTHARRDAPVADPRHVRSWRRAVSPSSTAACKGRRTMRPVPP